MSEPKYIKINGVMRKNPNHPANQAKPQSTLYNPDKALVPVPSVEDLVEQNMVMATGDEIEMPPSTERAVEAIQDPCILEQYAPGMDTAELVDGLGEIFDKYEIPLGMMSKLLQLSFEDFHLEFVQDDSGSMMMRDATIYADSQFTATGAAPPPRPSSGFGNIFNGRETARNANILQCTRWDESKARVLTLLEILAYVPVQSIRISFLNRPDQVLLTHNGKTPQQFIQDARAQVEAAYGAEKPRYTTPIAECLASVFREANQREGRTAVYLLFDGLPDGGPRLVSNLLTTRNSYKIPFTFLSCTGNDDDVEWARDIEEKAAPDGSASYMAECDDFESERREVLHDQGVVVPYSYGMYLICNLVAALNPSDLDMLDEEIPFTKFTMDELCGRRLTAQEYDSYWDSFINNPFKNPVAQKVVKGRWNKRKREFENKDGPWVDSKAKKTPWYTRFLPSAQMARTTRMHLVASRPSAPRFGGVVRPPLLAHRPRFAMF